MLLKRIIATISVFAQDMNPAKGEKQQEENGSVDLRQKALAKLYEVI